jgi:hypothetical protein
LLHIPAMRIVRRPVIRTTSLALFGIGALLAGCVTSSNDGPPTVDAGPQGFDGGGVDSGATDTGPAGDGGGDEVDAAASCPPRTGAEVKHQTDLTQSETWAGDGSVHHVTFGITIRPGATLTLAPCAIVTVDAGLLITVSGTAAQPSKIVSQGTAKQPVLVTAADPTKPWGFFRGYTPESTMDFSYTTFEKGGSGTYHGATIHLRGADPLTVTPMLRADHVTIQGSGGVGIVMESGAGFTPESTQVTVSGSGNATDNASIEITPLGAGTLPNLDVSGNAPYGEVRIAALSLAVPTDLTLKNRGAPYHFTFDRVRVWSTSGSPTLTIEAGIEARFDDYLEIGEHTTGGPDNAAKLIAVGTSTSPIVFTSAKATKAAGDWPGIYMASAIGSKLSNVRIEYAGGFNGIVSANCRPVGSSDNAALFLGAGATGTYVPAPSDFSNVTIAHCAGHGIDSMWTSATFGPDITGGFTFDTITGCKQTNNGLTTGCGTNQGCLVP